MVQKRMKLGKNIMGFKDYMGKGTYAGIRFSGDDVDALVKLCKDLRLPNPTPREDLHITLLYSRKYIPNLELWEDIDEWAYPDKFHVFPTHDGKRALVLKLRSSYCIMRHTMLMDKYDATYDYEEYHPHVTLSYDIGDKAMPSFENLNTMPKEFHLALEYMEDLKLDWKPDNK
jgi:hypothetical protein